MGKKPDTAKWLPTGADEIRALGWDKPDVIIFSGDAYVDHPSFGAAVIGRIIESEGLRVAIVPQPNWRDDLRDFRKLGKPEYFFGVTAGNMDSMVNHYTSFRRLRSDDAYTPGGKAGFRPDYPSVVYTSILKKLYPDVPVILGGIEASMRRLTHYDYWKDKVEPSVLVSSGADMLVYGMGEQPIREIVRLLKKGVPFTSLKTVPQTVVKLPAGESLPFRKNWNDRLLNSFEKCVFDREAFAQNFVIFERESNRVNPPRLIEPCGEFNIIVNPPFPPLSTAEADRIYDLPFTYLPHPRYDKKATIPAYEMIKFSVNIHRGCFGGCSFCTISAHQGKFVVSRSEDSVMREIDRIALLPSFRGYLSDIGGPSANMYGMEGKNPELCKKCSRPSCIWPEVCSNLNTSHKRLTGLYRSINSRKDIKKAFVGSGIRYDLLFREWNKQAGETEMEYLKELILHHVSGRLKVAPEHTEDHVVSLMRKSPFSVFLKFKEQFDKITSGAGLNYELVPYFISSHPGCSISDMHNLAVKIRQYGLHPEQVQDFTPTPMTFSTMMYYLGKDPYTGKKLFTERKIEEKRKQKEMFFVRRSDKQRNGGKPKTKPG